MAATDHRTPRVDRYVTADEARDTITNRRRTVKTCPDAHDDSLGAGPTASDAVASGDDTPSGRDEAGGDRRESVAALAVMLDICTGTVRGLCP